MKPEEMDKPLNGKTSSVRRPARERLLAAAEELFYQDGVQSVGIDRVIERAGVAKASLYGNFNGKDDLVRAYLDARFEARRAAIETKLALHEAPRDKMLAVFDAMTEPLAKPNYRGCAFLRATAETRVAAKSAGTRDAGRANSCQASRRKPARRIPTCSPSSWWCSMTGLRPRRRWIATPLPQQRRGLPRCS